MEGEEVCGVCGSDFLQKEMTNPLKCPKCGSPNWWVRLDELYKKA